MHTKRDRQLNISGAAGTCDEDEVVTVFGFCEDLVHIGAKHGRLDNREVNTRCKGYGSRFFGGGAQDERASLWQEIIRFGDTEVALSDGVFVAVGRDEFYAERKKGTW